MSKKRKPPRVDNYTEFEIYVSKLYSAFGYVVTRDIGLSGNQTDLLCEKHIDGFKRTKLLVECKLRRDKSVGVNEVNKFYNLSSNLIRDGKISGAAIVTNTQFSKEARQICDHHPLITLKTTAELESELFDFSHLYLTSVMDYEREEIFSTYVPAAATIKNLSLKALSHCDAVDDALIEQISSTKPSLSLVLADFGGGKSTLLRTLHYKMAQKALVEVRARRPIFIELKNMHQYADIREFFFFRAAWRFT